MLLTEPPRNAIPNSAWTQTLKWSFLGLQVAGLYLVSTLLLLLFVLGFIFLSLASTILGQSQTSYWDVANFFLLILLQQPLIIVGIVVVIVASILTIRGAFRQKAWAHWAAMVLVAASIVPAIGVAVAFRDSAWWVIALPYSAACLAFLAAMTYAVARYGPWGATRSRTDALAAPPTL